MCARRMKQPPIARWGAQLHHRLMMRSPVLLALAVASWAWANSAAQHPAPRVTLDRASFDTTCAPCADFNRYANGGWISHAAIPARYSSWGNWEELIDKT